MLSSLSVFYLSSEFFTSVFRIKYRGLSSSLRCVIHVPPTLSSSIWYPKSYFVKSVRYNSIMRFFRPVVFCRLGSYILSSIPF